MFSRVNATFIILLILLSNLICSCKKQNISTDENGIIAAPFLRDPVFNTDIIIYIPPYSYINHPKDTIYSFYHMYGDSLLLGLSNLNSLNIPDISKYFPLIDSIPTNPVFSWTRTKNALVSVAIFERRIQVDEKTILNPLDIVWIWNTGMKSGRNGLVKFNEGCSVLRGEIQYGQPPHPLIRDKYYVWFIYAWNDDGTKIEASSRELPLYVFE